MCRKNRKYLSCVTWSTYFVEKCDCGGVHFTCKTSGTVGPELGGGVHLACKASSTVGPESGGGVHLACKASSTVGPELGLCDLKQNEASSVWVGRGYIYIYTTLGCPFLRMYLWGSLDLVFTHMPGECYRSLLGSVVVALTMCATSAECHQFLYDARPNLLISSSFFFLSFNLYLYFFQL